MRNLITLFENQRRLFMRFGEIPASGKSRIGASPNWVHAMQRTGDEEEGVSVYWTKYDKAKDQWVVEDCGNYASMDELICQAIAGDRKIYIVSGVEVGSYGADGEPLISDVKIEQEIEHDAVLVPGFYDGRETKTVWQWCGEIEFIHPDGRIYKDPLDWINETEIEETCGWASSFNGIVHDGNVLFRTINDEGLPVNKQATEIVNTMVENPIEDHWLRGPAILIRNFTKKKVQA